jgi:cob(I)alamin adenosyltransferase
LIVYNQVLIVDNFDLKIREIIMRLYTRTGDNGTTGLVGGERVAKDCLRLEAYGTVDELNSVLGLVVSYTSDDEVSLLLKKIQNELFTLGSDLASPYDEKTEKYNIPRVTKEMYAELENKIDHFSELVEPMRNFILPGGSKTASYLHLARTVCRRAERRAVELKRELETKSKLENVGNIIVYLNRLSDLLFALARYENKISNIPDIPWVKS